MTVVGHLQAAYDFSRTAREEFRNILFSKKCVLFSLIIKYLDRWVLRNKRIQSKGGTTRVSQLCYC